MTRSWGGHVKLLKDLRHPGPKINERAIAADLIEWLIEERERLTKENEALLRDLEWTRERAANVERQIS
jgi:hypothetical protein